MLSLVTDKKITNWFVFKNNKLLFWQTDLASISNEVFSDLKAHFVRHHFLGVYQHIDCYCAELPNDFLLPEGFELVAMRHILTKLSPEWYTSLAKSHAILNWDRNHQYCGACGGKTYHKPGAYERLCSNCGLGAYPRISPSAMVLIQKQDEILLARGPHFTEGVYGLIAGFVEAGESIEETIHREVKEEVNIEVKNLHYFGSQSWPFPDSLMIGYIAEYASGELIIDNVEIIDAGWYRYDKLPGLPSPISIARRMIDSVVAKLQEKNK